jgi:hypothetical protein
MAAIGFRSPQYGLLGKSKALKSRVACLGCLTVVLVTVGRTTREHRPRERAGLPGRSKPLKTEPQERYRGEINPEGVAGCKPSRACETLRTEGGGHGKSP